MSRDTTNDFSVLWLIPAGLAAGLCGVMLANGFNDQTRGAILGAACLCIYSINKFVEVTR